MPHRRHTDCVNTLLGITRSSLAYDRGSSCLGSWTRLTGRPARVRHAEFRILSEAPDPLQDGTGCVIGTESQIRGNAPGKRAEAQEKTEREQFQEIRLADRVGLSDSPGKNLDEPIPKKRGCDERRDGDQWCDDDALDGGTAEQKAGENAGGGERVWDEKTDPSMGPTRHACCLARTDCERSSTSGGHGGLDFLLFTLRNPPSGAPESRRMPAARINPPSVSHSQNPRSAEFALNGRQRSKINPLYPCNCRDVTVF